MQNKGHQTCLSLVMMTVATLTRPTAASPLGQEGRCAEDGVSGLEERGGW